jgi:hypothetical protein
MYPYDYKDTIEVFTGTNNNSLFKLTNKDTNKKKHYAETNKGHSSKNP